LDGFEEYPDPEEEKHVLNVKRSNALQNDLNEIEINLNAGMDLKLTTIDSGSYLKDQLIFFLTFVIYKLQ